MFPVPPQTTWLNDVNSIQDRIANERIKRVAVKRNLRLRVRVATSRAPRIRRLESENLESRCRVMETGHLRAAFQLVSSLIFLIYVHSTAVARLTLGVTLRGCPALWSALVSSNFCCQLRGRKSSPSRSAHSRRLLCEVQFRNQEPFTLMLPEPHPRIPRCVFTTNKHSGTMN